VEIHETAGTNLKLIPEKTGMFGNGRPTCHLHEDLRTGEVFCHAIGGDFANLEFTGSPYDSKFAGTLTELGGLGYRFVMKVGTEHGPGMDSPSEYNRQELFRLKLPMALPE
jgi:hypothetical protein